MAKPARVAAGWVTVGILHVQATQKHHRSNEPATHHPPTWSSTCCCSSWPRARSLDSSSCACRQRGRGGVHDALQPMHFIKTGRWEAKGHPMLHAMWHPTGQPQYSAALLAHHANQPLQCRLAGPAHRNQARSSPCSQPTCISCKSFSCSSWRNPPTTSRSGVAPPRPPLHSTVTVNEQGVRRARQMCCKCTQL